MEPCKICLQKTSWLIPHPKDNIFSLHMPFIFFFKPHPPAAPQFTQWRLFAEDNVRFETTSVHSYLNLFSFSKLKKKRPIVLGFLVAGLSAESNETYATSENIARPIWRNTELSSGHFSGQVFSGQTALPMAMKNISIWRGSWCKEPGMCPFA